ncbi:MAG: hypothetical protein ACC651_16445 [Candidatus Scalindua sp.]
MELAGHKKLATTKYYIEVNDDFLLEAVELVLIGYSGIAVSFTICGSSIMGRDIILDKIYIRNV